MIIAIALLFAIGALARVIAPFKSWNEVERLSSYIVIARCGEPTAPMPNVITINATRSDSAIEIVSVLKGTNSLGSSRLLTDHDLQKGEIYLIFGYCDGGICQAYEEYRVVPLGKNFHTNSIADKPFDEQVRLLFQLRLENLNRQMKTEQEVKQRLEEGVMK